MRIPVHKKTTLVSHRDAIGKVVRKMAGAAANIECPGIAVVLDAKKRVLGVLTDGDIRRSYSRGVDWNNPVSDIMTRDPIMLPPNLEQEEIRDEVFRQAEEATHLNSTYVRYVLVVNEDKVLLDVFDFFRLLWEDDARSELVIVMGLGFVGLTVAVALANVGYRVTGVDKSKQVIGELQKGISHIYEPGLQDMLRQLQRRNSIQLTTDFDQLPNTRTNYIIAVGTPVGNDGKPETTELELVIAEIGQKIRQGDQLIVRSTVPVGSTRNFIKPRIEEVSNLRVGVDFNLSFCPERTLAGNALDELFHLPQLVGGYTERCTARASRFWSRLTTSIVQFDKIESAELAKLANNSFRDLIFAFSNELIGLADVYNIDVNEVVSGANNGYPRDKIPMPSPGVGGYCLTKDPFLLSASFPDDEEQRLSLSSRRINQRAGDYPLIQMEKFAKANDKKLSLLSVFVIGIAFKGEPETNDTRGSSGLILARKLDKLGAQVTVWDEVIESKQLKKLDLVPVESKKCGYLDSDIILLMNNHRKNTEDLMSILLEGNRSRLVFDGWAQLNRQEIEAIEGVTYSSLGYISKI